MWVWECGLNNLTVPRLYSIPTIGNFVSTDAWRNITLHIINPQDRWSVCGTNWWEVGLIAATLDDDYCRTTEFSQSPWEDNSSSYCISWSELHLLVLVSPRVADSCAFEWVLDMAVYRVFWKKADCLML